MSQTPEKEEKLNNIHCQSWKQYSSLRLLLEPLGNNFAVIQALNPLPPLQNYRLVSQER